MKKTAVKAVCFLLLLCVLLGYANHVLTFKYDDGIYNMKTFYGVEENTVDVLTIGSSHAFMGISTGILWKEYGIASYDLGGAMQPMWNSYFYLKEALKTQTPKLVVLEGYRLEAGGEFAGDVHNIRSIHGMKWSQNKLDAIMASVPPERWSEFFLGYTQYHSRYTELSKEDFVVNKGDESYEYWKGSRIALETIPQEAMDVAEYTKCRELTEKTEKYYREIIELLQEKEIPLLIIITPYAGITPKHQEKFNTAKKIAEEYQVPFINYNLARDELQIDYRTDCVDESHLNYKGACKLTEALGQYIEEHYDIPDHRGEGAYHSWEQDAEYLYAGMEDQRLRENEDIDGIANALAKERYDIFLSIDGYCSVENEAVKNILSGVGIENPENGGILYLKDGQQLIWSSGEGENTKFFETERHDYGLKRNKMKDDSYDNEIWIDGKKYRTVHNGLNVVVFDTLLNSVADSFGVDADDSYQLHRQTELEE